VQVQQSVREPIRPPRDPLGKRPNIPNRFANLKQVLDGHVGQRWSEVQNIIYNHRKFKDRDTRPILRRTLRKLVCRSGRPPSDYHVFVVSEGILCRVNFDN
jgi:hypothetical protein